MTITLTAQAHPKASFSRLAVELFSRLTERGHDVWFRPVGNLDEAGGLPFAVRQRFTKEVHGRELVVTPLGWGTGPETSQSICFTMWETTRSPAINVDILNRFSEVWVPSQWNKSGLEHSGVTVPIKVVPLGVDTDLFRPAIKSRVFDPLAPEPPLVFGTVAWLGPSRDRKNLTAAVRAFQRAFRPEVKDVALRLKLLPGDDATGLLADPRITVTHDLLPPVKLAGWYQGLDCYVLPSKGEGWCLPALEAMACGSPVITSPCGGVTEFVTHANGYYVHGKLTKLDDQWGHQVEIDEEQLAEAMLRVYWDRNELRMRAKEAAKDAAKFTVEGMVDRVEANLTQNLP